MKPTPWQSQGLHLASWTSNPKGLKQANKQTGENDHNQVHEHSFWLDCSWVSGTSAGIVFPHLSALLTDVILTQAALPLWNKATNCHKLMSHPSNCHRLTSLPSNCLRLTSLPSNCHRLTSLPSNCHRLTLGIPCS